MIAAALLPSATTASSGFNWGGLVLLVALVAVAWPMWRRLRASLSRQRRERWAREEGWADQTEFTPENDPDLRREPPAEH